MRGLRRVIDAEPHDRVPSGVTAILWRESRTSRVAKLRRGFSGSCPPSSAVLELCESRAGGVEGQCAAAWLARGDSAAQMKPASSRAMATTAF